MISCICFFKRAYKWIFKTDFEHVWCRLSLSDNVNDKCTSNTAGRTKHFHLCSKWKMQECSVPSFISVWVLPLRQIHLVFLKTKSIHQLHIQLSDKSLVRNITVVLIQKSKLLFCISYNNARQSLPQIFDFFLVFSPLFLSQEWLSLFYTSAHSYFSRILRS